MDGLRIRRVPLITPEETSAVPEDHNPDLGRLAAAYGQLIPDNQPRPFHRR